MSAPREQVKSAVTLPLAAASARLRGRPGRPRKQSAGIDGGHVMGTSRADTRINGRPPRGTVVQQASAPRRREPIQPRLLSLRQTAEYLNLSLWTVRELEAAGTLHRIQLGAVRKLLFDRAALDQLIAASQT